MALLYAISALMKGAKAVFSRYYTQFQHVPPYDLELGVPQPDDTKEQIEDLAHELDKLEKLMSTLIRVVEKLQNSYAAFEFCLATAQQKCEHKQQELDATKKELEQQKQKHKQYVTHMQQQLDAINKFEQQKQKHKQYDTHMQQQLGQKHQKPASKKRKTHA